MVRRVFLVHGWGGSPEKDWFPWARKTLTEKGFGVVAPEMPETEHPKIEPWLNKIKEAVGEPREYDTFVGHSIGCQAILRYLETLPEKQKVGKVILVAPWWYLTLDANEEQADADPWLVQNVNFGKVKVKAGKFITVFSDDDPWVPIKENVKFFKKNLSPEIVIK